MPALEADNTLPSSETPVDSRSPDSTVTDADGLPTSGWLSRAIWKIAGVPIILATVIGLATLVFSFLGRWFFWAELICNFRLQLIGALMLLVPFQAIWRQWRLLSVNVVLIMVGGMVIWSTCVPDWSNTFVLFKGSNQRIMSFNVLGTNPNADEVVSMVQRQSPDVLVVLEYSGNWHKGLQPLYDDYPHRILLPRWHGFGIALFSRHPIQDSETIQLARDDTDAPMLVATIAPPDGPPYRVVGVHLLAPMSPERMKIRNREIREIRDCVQRYEATGIPAMVVGDFNCVPWSAHLQDMLRATGLRDSRYGHGYQGTWPSRYPLLRIPIDNCFVSRGIEVTNRRVLTESAGSDHLPIVVDFDVTFDTAIGELESTEE